MAIFLYCEHDDEELLVEVQSISIKFFFSILWLGFVYLRFLFFGTKQIITFFCFFCTIIFFSLPGALHWYYLCCWRACLC